ncbi:MAG: DUF222 domain-containing protein [Acidimicrobiia bacterium]
MANLSERYDMIEHMFDHVPAVRNRSDPWEAEWEVGWELLHGCPPPVEGHVIPPGLDMWEPGPVLAAILSSIEVDALTGHDRVVVLRAHQRLASHHQAECLQARSAITDAYRDELAIAEEEFAWEVAEAEVRAALRLTRRAASSDMTLAHHLHHRLPEVARALTDGDGLDARRGGDAPGGVHPGQRSQEA